MAFLRNTHSSFRLLCCGMSPPALAVTSQPPVVTGSSSVSRRPLAVDLSVGRWFGLFFEAPNKSDARFFFPLRNAPCCPVRTGKEDDGLLCGLMDSMSLLSARGMTKTGFEVCLPKRQSAPPEGGVGAERGCTPPRHVGRCVPGMDRLIAEGPGPTLRCSFCPLLWRTLGPSAAAETVV